MGRLGVREVPLYHSAYKIEYYIEALDDEGEVELTHISQLVDTLKSVVE